MAVKTTALVLYVQADAIQYVDLDLMDTPEGDTGPVRSRTQSAGNATEYHEIDLLKTQTLASLRKAVDNKRETSEK